MVEQAIRAQNSEVLALPKEIQAEFGKLVRELGAFQYFRSPPAHRGPAMVFAAGAPKFRRDDAWAEFMKAEFALSESARRKGDLFHQVREATSAAAEAAGREEALKSMVFEVRDIVLGKATAAARKLGIDEELSSFIALDVARFAEMKASLIAVSDLGIADADEYALAADIGLGEIRNGYGIAGVVDGIGTVGNPVPCLYVVNDLGAAKRFIEAKVREAVEAGLSKELSAELKDCIDRVCALASSLPEINHPSAATVPPKPVLSDPEWRVALSGAWDAAFGRKRVIAMDKAKDAIWTVVSENVLRKTAELNELEALAIPLSLMVTFLFVKDLDFEGKEAYRNSMDALACAVGDGLGAGGAEVGKLVACCTGEGPLGMEGLRRPS